MKRVRERERERERIPKNFLMRSNVKINIGPASEKPLQKKNIHIVVGPNNKLETHVMVCVSWIWVGPNLFFTYFNLYPCLIIS